MKRRPKVDNARIIGAESLAISRVCGHVADSLRTRVREKRRCIGLGRPGGAASPFRATICFGTGEKSRDKTWLRRIVSLFSMARAQCEPMRGWRSCIHRTCAHSFPGRPLVSSYVCLLVRRPFARSLARSFGSFSYRLFSKVYPPFRHRPRQFPAFLLSPLPPLSCFLFLHYPLPFVL